MRESANGLVSGESMTPGVVGAATRAPHLHSNEAGAGTGAARQTG